MACKRCENNPLPSNWSTRKCAFDVNGKFSPENWNCGTITALLQDQSYEDELRGDDETMQIRYCGEDIRGWIVLTRYKNRGRCSSIIHVGDFYPPESVTLDLCEAVLGAAERMKA